MGDLDRRIKLEQDVWDSVSDKQFSDESMLQITYPGYRERFNSSIENRYIYKFLGDVEGKKVLECGCGSGVMSVVFALGGAHVTAFDVSSNSLKVARRRARYHGLEDRIDFSMAAAEHLCFSDETFDIVFGTAILHHVVLPLALGEMVRVLKPGGKAAFIEPLGTNPVLNFARNHLPYPGKDEHGNDIPFTYREINLMRNYFSNLQFREFRLVAMLFQLVGRREETFDERLKQEAIQARIFRFADPLDTAVTTLFPFMRRFCQIVAVLCEKQEEISRTILKNP
ncbi:MAG: class I SAM-dependent methyltransferase [bacterium]